MKNYRKEQLKLAVLLEVNDSVKKNGTIINGAEKRIVPDETYNRMMLNGKQTKGRKELQFVLYDFKKDGIVELVSRGQFKENNATYNNRMEKMFDIQNKIDSGEIKAEEILLNEKTLKEIKVTMESEKDWTPKPVEKVVADDKIESASEVETDTKFDSGLEIEGASQVENVGVSKNTDISKFSDLENDGLNANGADESGSSDKVIYETKFLKATVDDSGATKVQFKNSDKEIVVDGENKAEELLVDNKEEQVNNEDGSIDETVKEESAVEDIEDTQESKENEIADSGDEINNTENVLVENDLKLADGMKTDSDNGVKVGNGKGKGKKGKRK